MTTEQPRRYNSPEWTTEEHQRDLAWIDQHLDLFWEASKAAYERKGRGAVAVDVRAWPKEEKPNDQITFGYFVQASVDELRDEEVIRLLRDYKPEQEFVIVLLKSKYRNAYKIPVGFIESTDQNHAPESKGF